MLKIDRRAAKIESVLAGAGFKAFFVGGCVRDLLMGKPASDYDMAVDALPQRVGEVLRNAGFRVFGVGEKYGTVGTVFDGLKLEITTFRKDFDYSDGRHPEKVEFCDDITTDLERRDFTVNSIAYSSFSGLHDPFGGQKDIKDRVLRCCGDPFERFSEDALRILRLFRFAATLGFEIEEGTLSAAEKLKKRVDSIAAERVFVEFEKIILSDSVKIIAFTASGGFFEKYGIGQLENAESVVKTPANTVCRTAMTVLQAKADPDGVCKAFKPSTKMSVEIHGIHSLLSAPPPQTAAELKRAFCDFDIFLWADILSCYAALGYDCAGLYGLAEKIISEKQPFLISHLAVDGKDLLSLGLCGKEVGRALEACRQYVIDRPEQNSAEALTAFCRNKNFGE